MINAFINNKETSINKFFSDEWVYGKSKFIDKQKIDVCILIINSLEFKIKMQLKYEELIKELKDDDDLTNENFIQETYNVANYPTFEDILNSPEGSYKIDFVNTFFALPILYELTNKVKSGTNKEEWVIKIIDTIKEEGDKIIITTKAQLITHQPTSY